MIRLYLRKENNFINGHTSEPVEATHYIVETNRLSYLFEPQLSFILQQFSLYLLQMERSYWIERNNYTSITAFHFLIPSRDCKNDIRWTEAFDFKTYVEKMFSEPCMLCAGGRCYV